MPQEQHHPKPAEAKALRDLATSCKALFVWEDGPLLTAMRNGDLLLVDEISLADDAVLERLNSLMEEEPTLTRRRECGHDTGASNVNQRRLQTAARTTHQGFVLQLQCSKPLGTTQVLTL